MALGSPGLPDVPLQSRADAAPAPDQAAGGDMTDAIDRLAERMKARPDNVEGWALLARSYTQVNRFDDAAAAYAKALALTPGDPDLLGGQGEVLVLAAQGVVTPAARASFDAVLTQDPQSVAARYYLGLAEAQAGHPEVAYDLWLALLQSAPAGAPWFGEVRQSVARLAAQLGKEMPEIAVPEAAGGPSAGDVEAASEMSAEDREAMVAAMVANLAARMEQTPGDVDGWLRLGRAYQVLGRAAEAAAAYGRALALLPEDDPRREELQRQGLQD
jgi:cytochrome c-type biogenesis protein CcmH